jgi:aminoglycoside phosphotransferase (APT) family kinase protein
VTAAPPAHPAVSLETARLLVDEQFPHYAGLELGPLSEGWDNAMIRLGEGLAVRMPRMEQTVASLLKERALLHTLGSTWTFPFPRIVGDGEPGHGYPWPWSIITWLEGSLAVDAPLGTAGAAAFGTALGEVHTPAPSDAPYNDEQSLPLSGRDEQVRQLIAALGEGPAQAGAALSREAAQAVWGAALEAPDAPHRVWSHADLHGYNVLTGPGGSLAGIIDWGDLAACDPAVDLGFAYTLTDAAGIDAMMAAYLAARPGDPGLSRRVRGLGLHASLRMAAWPDASTATMGWRGLAILGVAQAG